MGAGMEKQGDLVQGTLDMLVLKALARGTKHGYAVAEWIHESSNDVLHVEEGALYPALHRLELRGLLSAEWGASENNRRAECFLLWAAGGEEMAKGGGEVVGESGGGWAVKEDGVRRKGW